MTNTQDNSSPAHFKGKGALDHVAEAKARGIIASTEIHGTEIPGHLSAAADAAKETSLAMLILWIVLYHVQLPTAQILFVLSIFGLGWVIWKGGRSAWLAWSRLERMHRVVSQEQFEIQHHRQQERDELKELYASKGFEGKLLEDVMDVLMADDERLLRVMVEEELCLNLESHEHPLKQGLGAVLGALAGAFFCWMGILIFPAYGAWIAGLIVIASGAGVAAYFEDNRVISAIVWNLGLAALATGTVYFLLDYLRGIS